jgi:DNA-binding response OmpR family regulator
LPVVFITAHDDRRTRTAVERTGRQLLVKPVDGDDLLAAIANAIAA